MTKLSYTTDRNTQEEALHIIRRCPHLAHSPKGICVGCREQHQPLLGYSDDELAALEADFWTDWNAP